MAGLSLLTAGFQTFSAERHEAYYHRGLHRVGFSIVDIVLLVGYLTMNVMHVRSAKYGSIFEVWKITQLLKVEALATIRRIPRGVLILVCFRVVKRLFGLLPESNDALVARELSNIALAFPVPPFLEDTKRTSCPG